MNHSSLCLTLIMCHSLPHFSISLSPFPWSQVSTTPTLNSAISINHFQFPPLGTVKFPILPPLSHPGHSMAHAKTDSDVTSMDTSSSPKRAVYYVQSPSRDSHDGDKSSTATHATPACNSPVDSPSHHSYVHHSRASSSSRVSAGSYNNIASYWGRNNKGTRKNKLGSWTHDQCKVIQEEEGYYGEREGFSRRKTQIFVGILAFAFIFTLFCFIIAGVARPHKVRISVKVL